MKTQTIDVKVKSKEVFYNHFLANDEPNNETTTLKIEPLTNSPVKKVQYMFHWKDWLEKMEEVKGYQKYARFKNTNPEDVLRITYIANTESPIILAAIRGNCNGNPLFPENSATIIYLENLSQKWKIL